MPSGREEDDEEELEEVEEAVEEAEEGAGAEDVSAAVSMNRSSSHCSTSVQR